MQADVCVLGGGPAGAASALFARQAGLSVLLVERARGPRDKVCGEFLSGEALGTLERLGLREEVRRIAQVGIGRVRLFGGDAAEAEAALGVAGGDAAWGVPRLRLDALLLDACRARGVTVVEGVQARMDRSGGGWCVAFPGAHNQDEAHARVLVAADGRLSPYAVPLERETRSGPRRFGIKAHFLVPAMPRDAVDLHVFDGGYGGVNAVHPNPGEPDTGVVNLCLAVNEDLLEAGEAGLDHLVRARVLARPGAQEALQSAIRISRWQSAGPLWYGARRGPDPSVFRVGDAFATPDPFAGEGMAAALAGGEAVTPYLAAACAQPETTAACVSAYNRDFGERLAPRLALCLRIRRLLEGGFAAPLLAGLSAYPELLSLAFTRTRIAEL